MADVELADAACLVLWPAGTRGHDQEMGAITYLLMVARTVGYGRMAQLAAQLDELWRDPGRKVEFEQRQREFLKMMEEGRVQTLIKKVEG